MKRKLMALLLAALMAMTAAQALTNVLPKIDCGAFEKYASYTIDETTGDWSVHTNEADAVLTQIADGGYSNLIYFYLELTGNARTNIIVPTLNIVYVGKAVETDAASFRVGDLRYDYTVVSELTELGKANCGIAKLYLGEDGMQMLREMETADEVSVRLHGETVRSTKIERKKTYSDKITALEAASLNASGALLDELDGTGFEGYALWDISLSVWEKAQGVESRSSVTTVRKSDSVTLKERFGMLSRGDSGSGVKALQALLRENGFLSGDTSGTYGDKTVQAVARAQKYYGLVETGSADADLIDLLEGKATAAEADDDEAAPMQYTGDAAALRLDRWWVAESVLTSEGGASQTCANRDNALLIAEGEIKNLSVENLNLYWQISGELVYEDKYSYEVTFLCERNDGELFDTELIPLAQSRLIVCAEIPQAVAEGEGACALKLYIGEETVEYPIR